VFDPAFPEDEQKASDVVNALLERGQKKFPRESMEHWRQRLGNCCGAGEIQEENVTDYNQVFRRIEAEVKVSCV
jgi:hypothetical protein